MLGRAAIPNENNLLPDYVAACATPVTLGGHSEVDPPLPIPNRTVKRLCADDSADPRVKVGHRQAINPAQ